MVATLPDKEYVTVRGVKVLATPRPYFVRRLFRYKAGEHLYASGPTQDGKTTLIYQLGSVTISPRLPMITLVMKPRDKVPAAWTRHLGHVETPNWPPRKRLPWENKVTGYTHWPRHTFNVQADNAHLTAEFKKSLTDSYSKGHRIVFADEIYGLLAELGLQDEVIAILSRGGGMGVGLWAASQRAAGSQGHGIPGHLPSNSTHLLLGRDPDARMRVRGGEISGVDPKLVAEVTAGLRRFEFLYVHKADENGGPYYCIVGA